MTTLSGSPAASLGPTVILWGVWVSSVLKAEEVAVETRLVRGRKGGFQFAVNLP